MAKNLKVTHKHQGLSSAEADKRLKQEGYNELQQADHHGLVGLFLNVASEPMILLLLVCSWLYIVLGDLHEALALFFSIVLVIAIEFFQELKTERAVAALKDLSSPRALVIRNGKTKRIPGREVVRGDLVLLAEGDRVPADGVLLEVSNLKIDESILTGESVPVAKNANLAKESMAGPGGDNTPYAYASTLVVSGRGMLRVLATGANTEVGRIGETIKQIKPSKTKLQLEVNGLVKLVGSVGALMCLLVVVIYGLTRGDWVNGLLYGLSLAMSILPQEFPVILVIFLAMGAWRLSRHQVLARQQKAIQALGSATVLCTDKTGTLTMNRLALVAIYNGRSHWEARHGKLPEAFHEALELSYLASYGQSSDPLEKAILNLTAEQLGETEHIHQTWTLVKEYPLSRQLLAVTHIWRSQGRAEQYSGAAKGAPEAIFKLCRLTVAAVTLASRS